MNLYETLNRLCTPAFLYAVVHIVLLVLQMISALRMGSLFRSDVLSAFVINIVFVVAIIYGLNWLCTKNLGILSWLLVLAPFLAMLGFARPGHRTISLADPNPLSAFM